MKHPLFTPPIPAGAWIKGRYATNKHHYTTEVDSPDACNFCVIGWIDKNHPDRAERAGIYHASREVVSRETNGLTDSILAFNDMDSTTATDVNRMLDLINQTVEKGIYAVIECGDDAHRRIIFQAEVKNRDGCNCDLIAEYLTQDEANKIAQATPAPAPAR